MAYLESAYNTDNQLANQWEISEDNMVAVPSFKYRVESVNMPFYKLEVETKPSGEKVWKSLTEISEITMTLRESPDFSIYTYFHDWFGKFYDLENRVFKKQETYTGGGAFSFDQYINHKNFTLKFYQLSPFPLSVPLAGTYGELLNLGSSALESAGITAEKSTMEFHLKNCKILGIDNLSLSYEGNPLQFSISMIAQEIVSEKPTI